MRDLDYLSDKRIEVIKEITPICEAFGIKEFDYIITESGGERLQLSDTLIGCSSNSISAIVDELIGYIFVKIYCHNRSIGAFETQTLNVIRQYWIKEVQHEY